MKLGESIKARRKSAGLTQTEAAERAGWKQPFWSELESADANPQLDTLAVVARVLKCDVRDLF